MGKPRMLWVDLTVSVKEGGVPFHFDRFADIYPCTEVKNLDSVLNDTPVDAVFFDFDFPDRSSPA